MKSTTSTLEASAVDSLIEAIAQISSGQRAMPTATEGSVIASRYRLVRELGRGANGVVWEAYDLVGRCDVGVKLLATPARRHAARARTEVSSLRRLRFPGVARLLDEGSDGAHVFLVMPIVRGERFPGRPPPVDPATLLHPAELLLETIGRVHATGVVHRDLKPANVLVDGEGRPTLLDFGLSIVAGFADADPDAVVGTPAYLAPEQVLGHSVDARADLYAIGVMLYHAVAGRFPHEETDIEALLASKALPPPALASVAPHVPDDFARAVDALLATRADDRPASAATALALLRARRPRRPAPTLWLEASRDASAPFRPDELRPLFAGYDRLTGLPSDAARVLHERTAGAPQRVRETVAAWVRAGRCRWAEGERRLVVHRESLDELEGELWADNASAGDAFVDDAVKLARSLAAGGRLGNAIVALHEALVVLRRNGAAAPARREQVLALWTEIALVEGTPHALDRVLYEVCRSQSPTALERQLEELVRAALAVWAWSPRASELAERVPPLEDAGLELRRWGVRVLAARRDTMAREEAVVADVVGLAQRASDPRLSASAPGWLGRLRYRQGRYAEAARLHAEAATRMPWRADRIAASLHAASSYLEAFDEDQALAFATRARCEARESRSAYFTGRAEWVLRSVAYRVGRDHYVDDELIGAARELGAPDLIAMIGLVEATHAFRASDLRAAALAAEAYESWSQVGEPIASLLAGSLAVSHGWPLPDDALARLRAASWASDVPGIGVQTAALLKKGGEPGPDPETALRLASTVPRDRWARRMDVLSVDESLDLLGVAPP